jgi:hypothetical protein
MSEIRKYVLVNANDQEENHEYNLLHDAVEDAKRRHVPMAVIARTYVFDDSEMVWNTEGSDVWPVNGGQR